MDSPLPPEVLDLTQDIDRVAVEVVTTVSVLRTLAGVATAQAEQLERMRIELAEKLKLIGLECRPVQLPPELEAVTEAQRLFDTVAGR